MHSRQIVRPIHLAFSISSFFIASCDDGRGNVAGQAGNRLVVDSPAYDADGDGLGGQYDCDPDDATLPAACPLAEGEPGGPVWCDDGVAVPESKSLMNWANHLETVDGREKGLREYLYDAAGQDQVPTDCNVALLATRGGPQDSNTEQLTRYVIEGLETGSVGYVLGGRSFWPNNADHWDFPNHAIDTSCESADGRTRLRELHEACTTAVSLRRISPWDPCGSQYDGHAFLVGGGQSAGEYPKANLLRALEEGIAAGLFGEVEQVLDIDDQHWSNSCRASLGARGCCHIANGPREHSGHAGVQLIIPTDILKYGPICKNPDDLLHKYECSDLAAHPPLESLGNLLRDVLDQGPRVRVEIENGATPEELVSHYPLGEEALLAVLHSGWKEKDIIAVLEANRPLSDRVLLEAVEVLEHENWMVPLFANSSPLSVDVTLSLITKMQNHEFLSRVLVAGSPGQSDTVLLAAIETMGSSPQLMDVLTENCPLSATVMDVARNTFAKSKKDLVRLEECR
jgi:hypothetical protein